MNEPRRLAACDQSDGATGGVVAGQIRGRSLA